MWVAAFGLLLVVAVILASLLSFTHNIVVGSFTPRLNGETRKKIWTGAVAPGLAEYHAGINHCF